MDTAQRYFYIRLTRQMLGSLRETERMGLGVRYSADCTARTVDTYERRKKKRKKKKKKPRYARDTNQERGDIVALMPAATRFRV